MARKRIWKDWQPADASIPEDEREFTGKVIQIINSDSLSVDTGNGMKKIFLSSIRPVRLDDIDESIRAKVCFWPIFICNHDILLRYRGSMCPESDKRTFTTIEGYRLPEN